MARETEGVCVPVGDSNLVGFRGSRVRGTCWPLQAQSGKHPKGMPDEDVEGRWSHHMYASSYLLKGRQRDNCV